MSKPAIPRVGTYDLVASLGAGQLFESWHAFDAELGRNVFLKIQRTDIELKPEEGGFIERHFELWKVFSRAPIRALPKIFVVGKLEGRAYMVTEFIKGVRLSLWLNNLKSTELVPALWYALGELATVIREIHALGLLHGDISLANILVSYPHGIYLVDPAPTESLSPSNGCAMRVMTAQFAASEVRNGEAFQPESDLYSLGAVLAASVETLGLKVDGLLGEIIAGLTAADPNVRKAAFEKVFERPRSDGMRFLSPLAAMAEQALAAGSTSADGQDSLHSSVTQIVLVPQQRESASATVSAGAGTMAELVPATNIAKPKDGSRECVSRIMAVPMPGKTANAASADFLVTAPPIVKLDETFVLELWAAPSEFRDTMRACALKSGRVVERGGRPHVALPDSQLVTVALNLPGFSVDEPIQQLYWMNQLANVGFLVTPDPGTKPGLKPGRIKLLINDLPIASIMFDVRVGERDQVDGTAEMQATVKRISRAFASYASDDRSDVLRRVQGMRAVGVDVFLDVLSLRAGDDWEATLYREIGRSDVFFLFWSDAARSSPWVEREWRFALANRGLDFINPVPLADPRVVSPPPELKAKHFNDLVLLYLAHQQTER